MFSVLLWLVADLFSSLLSFSFFLLLLFLISPKAGDGNDPSVPTYDTVAQVVIVGFCAFIYLLLAAAFGFYGFKFYAVFVEIGNTLTVHQQKRRTVITKLLNITGSFLHHLLPIF